VNTGWFLKKHRLLILPFHDDIYTRRSIREGLFEGLLVE